MGGAGAISAAAHLRTVDFVRMIDDGLAGRVVEARSHAEAPLPVVLALFAEPNPAVITGVLHAQGRLPTPDVRMPLTHASTSAVDAAPAAIGPIPRRQNPRPVPNGTDLGFCPAARCYWT